MSSDKSIGKSLLFISDISSIYRENIKKISESINIRNGYRQLLHELCIKDGCTQLDLVHRTAFKAPTVSITLRKMEKDGLVQRETDDNDLRQTKVYITDKGRELYNSLRAKICELDESIFRNIDEESKIVFLDILSLIRKNIAK